MSRIRYNSFDEIDSFGYFMVRMEMIVFHFCNAHKIFAIENVSKLWWKKIDVRARHGAQSSWIVSINELKIHEKTF